MNRRQFLRLVYGASVALAGAQTISAAPFFFPVYTPPRHIRYFRAADEWDIPRRGVRMIEFSGPGRKFRAYMARTPGGLLVLSPVCSHLGCLVAWNDAKGEFDCPCHGGRYDISGIVIGGPPPRPLSRLPYKIENGSLMVGLEV
ncbi:MAG: Rieske 2Fe-2S domain-containing protein [Nitrospiraceae bacterium]|nr:Rieske 2Fe-2S domain-containing protein [Nitrospiraceae bacterium]